MWPPKTRRLKSACCWQPPSCPNRSKSMPWRLKTGIWIPVGSPCRSCRSKPCAAFFWLPPYSPLFCCTVWLLQRAAATYCPITSGGLSPCAVCCCWCWRRCWCAMSCFWCATTAKACSVRRLHVGCRGCLLWLPYCRACFCSVFPPSLLTVRLILGLATIPMRL